MINVHDKFLEQCDENELFLMLHIAKHMGKDLTAFPKNDTLCKATGWEIKKLQRIKKRCIEKGFIEVVDQRKNGFQIPNLYRVKTPHLSVFVSLKDKGDAPTPKWDSRIPQNGIGSIPQNGTTEVLTIQVLNTADFDKSAATSNNIHYTFAEFWNDYGFKKGSKAKAMLRFGKLTGRDLEDLKKALPFYLRDTVVKEEAKQRGAGFKPMRKYPEFFLSGRLWEAYMDQASSAAASDAQPTEYDEAYGKYLEWVKTECPTVLQECKHLSKSQFIAYKTTYYVQGKSWIGDSMEFKYLTTAHKEMEINPEIRHSYGDAFALHCRKVEQHVKAHSI